MSGIRKKGLLDLPNEVLGLIAEQLYDPLVLTQQDRLSTSLLLHYCMHCELIISMGYILHRRHVTDQAGRTGLVDRIRLDLPSSP
jgi:hypothetical protein